MLADTVWVWVFLLAIAGWIVLSLLIGRRLGRAIRARLERRRARRPVQRGLWAGRERFEPYPYSLDNLPPVLAPYAEGIRALTVAAVSLRADPVERPLPVETSKFGGVPCLPEAAPWPADPEGRPLTFMGQLNFAEIRAAVEAAGGPVAPELPKAGVLSFFYDLTAEPASVPEPSDMAPLEARLVPRPFRSLPSLADGVAPLPAMPEEAREEYHELEVSLTHPPTHRVGGYSTPVQADPRGELPGVRQGWQTPGDWCLLWQIDTNDASLTMWYDCGVFYLLLPVADLRAARFDRLWFIAQCH